MVLHDGGIGPKVNAYNISDARLQMFYFGFPLATRDVVDSNPQLANNGSFDMSWDPGVLQWVLAGIYGVTTSLLAPNGSTMWSDAFFVHVTAPGGVGAILPILLLLIGAYELFELARASGGQSASPPKQPTAPASASGDASAPAIRLRRGRGGRSDGTEGARISAAGRGLGCGVVLGIVAVLLAQQFAYLNLSVLVPAVEDLVIAAVIGGVLGGLIGWGLGRRYLASYPMATGPSGP